MRGGCVIAIACKRMRVSDISRSGVGMYDVRKVGWEKCNM